MMYRKSFRFALIVVAILGASSNILAQVYIGNNGANRPGSQNINLNVTKIGGQLSPTDELIIRSREIEQRQREVDQLIQLERERIAAEDAKSLREEALALEQQKQEHRQILQADRQSQVEFARKLQMERSERAKKFLAKQSANKLTVKASPIRSPKSTVANPTQIRQASALGDDNMPARQATDAFVKSIINAAVERWYGERKYWPADDLSDIRADKSYFPSGIPNSPIDGSPYTLNPVTHRAE